MIPQKRVRRSVQVEHARRKGNANVGVATIVTSDIAADSHMLRPCTVTGLPNMDYP